MTTFEIGEIAILQNMPDRHKGLNGEECTIVRIVKKGEVFRINGVTRPVEIDGYGITASGDIRAIVRPEHLRKKPNPSSDDALQVYEALVDRLTRPLGVV
jgi:hypothetical protein